MPTLPLSYSATSGSAFVETMTTLADSSPSFLIWCPPSAPGGKATTSPRLAGGRRRACAQSATHATRRAVLRSRGGSDRRTVPGRAGLPIRIRPGFQPERAASRLRRPSREAHPRRCGHPPRLLSLTRPTTRNVRPQAASLAWAGVLSPDASGLVEKRSAAAGEHDAAGVDPEQAPRERVVEDGMARAVTPPGLDRVVVGPRTVADP